MAKQLTVHLESNGIIPALQSAYRRNHLTETAMLKICNEALLAADNGMVTLVVLLDYSAAFDTVDHTIVLDILERRCGLTGEALPATFTVVRTLWPLVVPLLRQFTLTACGLPQGSSHGPLKFVVYAADLHTLTSRHNVRLHSFADDTQLYKHTRIGDYSRPSKTSLQPLQRSTVGVSHAA